MLDRVLSTPLDEVSFQEMLMKQVGKQKWTLP